MPVPPPVKGVQKAREPESASERIESGRLAERQRRDSHARRDEVEEREEREKLEREQRQTDSADQPRAHNGTLAWIDVKRIELKRKETNVEGFRAQKRII